MLDAWKMALEVLVYCAPSPRLELDARCVMARARTLSTVSSVGDLRRQYHTRACAVARLGLRDTRRGIEVLSPREIEDAAFGLRYLELVMGRPVALRTGRLSGWLLAAAG